LTLSTLRGTVWVLTN